jgi:hypothetical protein
LWRAVAGMGVNGLSAWGLPCDKRRTHVSLLRYEKKNLVNFSSICRSHVTVLSGIQVYRFYEMSWNYE